MTAERRPTANVGPQFKASLAGGQRGPIDISNQEWENGFHKEMRDLGVGPLMLMAAPANASDPSRSPAQKSRR